eukprot:gnl/TRDRNA2_/TRDRNA2_171389_c0_seq2.p1 gnl/TRDRNA2_/TRDRNA2_171389_c0~~gnl/TRDRNA2_/TRDRNA2_171389_c0_seq2.p1  ORF type:complete len:374 (+),score=37.33 gnl/TRDRNA2_/TRDRNA2_171389_c0_seq2:89-1123(+)
MSKDGNPDSRWTSLYADDQWIAVDLGKKHDVTHVAIRWEAAYAAKYLIQGSDDECLEDAAWVTMATEIGREGWKTSKLRANCSARWVRMLGMRRATEFGFSILEMLVFGTPSPDKAPSCESKMTPVAEEPSITLKCPRLGVYVGKAFDVAHPGDHVLYEVILRSFAACTVQSTTIRQSTSEAAPSSGEPSWLTECNFSIDGSWKFDGLDITLNTCAVSASCALITGSGDDALVKADVAHLGEDAVFRMPVAAEGEALRFNDVECSWSNPPPSQVKVRFQYKGQAWSHLFELQLDGTVLELKHRMAAASTEEAEWFDLYRLGRCLGENEMLEDGQVLDFWFKAPA